jgi:hypothetical protein
MECKLTLRSFRSWGEKKNDHEKTKQPFRDRFFSAVKAPMQIKPQKYPLRMIAAS